MIRTDSLINDINNSNCFIVQNQVNGKCIIIDPGSRDISKILSFLESNSLEPDYIILTHSHFDHIAGVEKLKTQKNLKIIACQLCSDKIVDPIRNLSYSADIGSIVSPKADIIVENMDDGRIGWYDTVIKCFLTPGHSRCSICIQIDSMLFVGDTIIKGCRTKITHPDGKSDELRKSLGYIYDTMPQDIFVFPGHGESFFLRTQDISISLNK
jgi:hydroxyacylglutathione hydrolase